MFKAVLSCVLEPVMPLYALNMPQCQHGYVPGRGTDFATHTLLTAASLARSRGLCFFALFVDLVKAFDRIIREVLIGWPEGASADP
eukprot:5555703-Heterocapsa_arctica.AAC.1